VIICIPKERLKGETRVAITPEACSKLKNAGADIIIEKGAGSLSRYTDAQYKKSGGKVVPSVKSVLKKADVVLRVNASSSAEIAAMKKGCLHISFFNPFENKPLVSQFKKKNVNAVSMEFIPRITIAQKMDALSSQANIAGYEAVVIASTYVSKIFPMLMTAAGTISPARVFVIGAGVAGLQAIATAKRLGARVEAFDTRPVVEEQVKSLGARFVKIDLGQTGQTKDGYAKALTAAQIKKQQAGIAKVCSESDIVITTAQLFGRKAPRIITKKMVQNMKPGSVIVDMAAASGGNVEGSKPDKDIKIGDVTVLGITNLAGRAAEHASAMYANNLVNFLISYIDKEAKTLLLPDDDPVLKGALLVKDGELFSDTYINIIKGK
jgi:NAD(P) transhydrogenase subunit alpha